MYILTVHVNLECWILFFFFQAVDGIRGADVTGVQTCALPLLVWPLPRSEYAPTVVAAVQAEPGRPPAFAEREMYEAIWQRHTHRNPFTSEPMAESMVVALEQAAGFEFATLRMLTSSEAAIVLDLAARASAELAADVEHRIELQDWI